MKALIQFFSIIPLFLFANGGSVTSNRYNTSLIGDTRATGPAGTLSSAYGQLYLSSTQSINFTGSDTYIAIPFNAFSPSSNVDGSTSSPATITILEGGVYQLSVSLYFSTEDSLEGPFTAANYTLGISTNSGSTAAAAAIYAETAGFYTLNYNALVTYSANNTIQFYIKASEVGAGPFADVVTAVSGVAYVMQIAE